ncbi:DUF5615 family PIN-like protein [Nocardia sp. NPDC049149]|uniref:DUF5615 family PIN-like protein n=1 Tax=Nocardia sp. NPDC049149 TaxID=3364315 RepID=UPI00371111EC
MRFVLDHDVDVAVGAYLRKLRHEAWSVGSAGLAKAVDDDLTVYATNQKAVLITHDAEFSKRRNKHVVGRHIWLSCDEWRAVELLTQDLDQILPALERKTDLFVRLSFGMDPILTFG